MKQVTVIFDNPKDNYTTYVSGDIPDYELEGYFVDNWFNVGKYPIKNMQQCKEIKIWKD